MDFTPQIEARRRALLNDIDRRIERALDPFDEALDWFLGDLFESRLPADWRQRWHTFVAAQAAEGRTAEPQSVREMEEWIEAWARFCDLLPRGANGVTQLQAASQSSPTTATSAVSRPPKSSRPEAPVTRPPEKPAAPKWPRLTPKERDAVQSSTELPSWYPFQPRNRMDALWEQIFERLGQTARDRLLAVFQGFAGLGRTSTAMGMAQEADIDPLFAKLDKVQKAYDDYLAARIEFQREWTRYLKTEWLIGVDVMALVKKIDDGLPIRIAQMSSPLDEQVKSARAASLRAHDAALKRVEGVYTAVVWTDWVITAVQFIGFGLTVGAGARQVYKYYVEKKVARAVAFRIAASYTVTQIAVAATTFAVASKVVPEVLSYAGLDEAEVQVGMAAFAAIGVLSGLAARPISRRAATGTLERPAKPEPQSPARSPKKSRKQRLKKGADFDNERRSEYSYSEVYVLSKDGTRRYKLDNYSRTRGEIVFRRRTQFAEITVKSAMGYLREFVRKYSPGTIIARVQTNKALAGEKLKGRMILEVPVQHKAIPKRILDEASKREITIRDINGRVYE